MSPRPTGHADPTGPASSAPDPAAADPTAPAASRPAARGSAWMALGALLVALATTPFGIDLGGAEFGRLVDGPVEVAGDDGWRPLEVPATVPAGARLRVGEQAARVEVEDGLLTLSEGTELVAHAAAPRLRQGSVLVEADEPLTVRVGATTAEGRGTWRVDVGAASRVATYGGRLVVGDEQGERDLARFRQLGVRDGALEPGLRPLRYDDDDPWDQWLLADALAVDRLVDRLQASLERSYGRTPREADFYAAFVVVDDAGLASDLSELAVSVDDDRFGPPADLLLAVAAVDALHVEAGLTVTEARERVVELRRAGASWGLVLVEHDLGASALREAADRAFAQVEQTPPPAPPEPEPDPAEDDTPVAPVEEEPAAPAAPEPAPAPAEPAPAPSGGGGGPPDDDPEEGPAGGALDPVDDTVRDTEDAAGNLIEGTGEAVGGLVEDTSDTLTDTLDGVGSLLGR